MFQSEDNYEELKTPILSFYRLDDTDYEYSEIAITDSGIEWWEELFMLSSDDAIVIIHPKSRQYEVTSSL